MRLQTLALALCTTLQSPCQYFVRDWSLITGKGGGGYKTGGEGAWEVLPLRKGEGAEKVLAMLKLGGAQQVLGLFLRSSLKF